MHIQFKDSGIFYVTLCIVGNSSRHYDGTSGYINPNTQRNIREEHNP